MTSPAPPRPDIAVFSPLARGGTSAHGGITPVILNLAQGFVNEGREVELLIFSPGDPRSLLPSLDPRIRVRNFGRGSRHRHLYRLRDYLRDRRPSVLLSAGQRPNLLAGYCKRLWRPPVRVFLGVHNALTPGLAELGRVNRWTRLRGMRAAYPAADGVICVSAGVARDLERYLTLPPEKLSVVHNPVLPAGGVPEVPQTPVHPWFEPGLPPVILGAGRLTRQKDFPTLIRAFAQVAERRESRLMIVGEGAERPELERLIANFGLADRIALPGFVENPMGYMGQARLFVLSSAWEGFGMVLVEAMAVGTPVLSTDCPSGPREILLDGALGALVPTSDPQALAQAMLRTMDSPPDPDRLRRRAADFTSDLAARRYLDLIFPGDRTKDPSDAST